jgi:CcmD family protein
MGKMVQRILFVLAGLVLNITGFAQANNDQPQMADAMRSNGKIYVVVTVLVVILLGIVFYLVRLDRKITKLEKENN